MLKSKKIRLLLFVLSVAWMAVIFIMSSQPAKESSQLSSGIVTRVVSAICSDFEDLTSKQQITISDTVTFIVRKSAHFFEYFILGMLVFVTVNTFERYKLFIRAISAVCFCIFYATSDEIHQYFVPGRACRFVDVCIDTAGSILAIVLLVLIVGRKKKYKSGELDA